jgi:acyl-CoA synthetase (AMP-forming)/AMP-acid ligase II
MPRIRTGWSNARSRLLLPRCRRLDLRRGDAVGQDVGMAGGTDLLIGDVFRVAAAAQPQRVAVALGEGSITYGELDRAANRHAHALRAMGVGHGDRVVMWSHTSIEAVPLFAGLAKLGAVFAPANALLGTEEAVEMVGLARPSALVVDETHAEAGAVVAERVGVPLLRLGAIGDDAPDVDVDEPALTERDLHVLFFTSGSTGRSKGVMLSHRVNYLRTHPGSQIEPRGATVCMYPLFHMGAWTIALQAFQTQTTLALVTQADPRLLCGEVERWRATHLNAIPAVWRRILDHLATPEGARHDLSSLRLVDSGTSATPPELLTGLREALPHASRRVFYGSTEAGAVTLLRDEEMDARPGACGVPQHSVAVRTDAVTGEMLVRGPLLFDGYYDDPGSTAAAFDLDGWFRTGDVAVTDDDGYWSIVGRVKDVIRTGGESVAPTEVEAVLADHPALADVAVVGLPDPQWGEVVCAVIVVADGADAPTLDVLLEHCGPRLAKFKRPRRVEVIDVIPRTPATNQVQRRLIIERIAT